MLTILPDTSFAAAEPSGKIADFIVVAEQGKTNEAATAVKGVGGAVKTINEKADTLKVSAPSNGFITYISESQSVVGAVSEEKPLGHVPPVVSRDSVMYGDDVAPAAASVLQAQPTSKAEASEDRDPMDDQLWGLEMINAFDARKDTSGEKVLVGVLDSGIDMTHPDIAANYNHELSRGFSSDAPPTPGDDPAGHGTHVAGTIGAALNGFGVSGVAPEASLVDIRVGTAEGYIFLDAFVNALTYAADIGVDVANMSFYIDPWLYNCTNNPADSPEQQLEQQATIEAVNRTLDYAHSQNVTLVAALGNAHRDLSYDTTDSSSPNYPPGEAHERAIDNETCFTLPAEGNHVLGIAALGSSARKSYFSNYGVEQIDLAAPGGDVFFSGTEPTIPNREFTDGVLSTFPLSIAQAAGFVDSEGNLTEAGAVRGFLVYTAEDGSYAVYLRAQGTSMAAPHTTGTAALIVDRYGWNGPKGWTMWPGFVGGILKLSATKTPCPEGNTITYPGLPDEYTAACEGKKKFNGFYGHGIVNAGRAIH